MYKVVFLVLGFLLIPLQSANCQSVGNTLIATVSHVSDGTPVYIDKLETGRKTIPVDTVYVQNGKVKVRLPKVAYQTMNVLSIKGVPGQLFFVNQNVPLRGVIYRDSLLRSTIKGGSANKLLGDYVDLQQQNHIRIKHFMDDYALGKFDKDEAANRLTAIKRQVRIENAVFLGRAVKYHADDLPTAFVFTDILNSGDMPYVTMKKLYDQLSSRLKSTYFGKQLGKKLHQYRGLLVGDIAPEFSGKTPSGKEFSLKDALAKKGKYTLVEFWASWCPYCRNEMPNVVKVYKKYHQKGFNILSVSLDTDKSAWVNGINQFGMDWPQVSHLKKWDDPIVKLYEVSSIPSNFLLNEQGEIVAKNLTGAKLAQKLEALLGN